MFRWAGGGIILSSVDTRYQLGLVFQAGSVIVPDRASTPQGTCELAMNAAVSASTSPAKEKWNFALSRNKKPSCGGRIGGTGAPGGGSLISDDTDSPLSGAKAATYTSPATLGWVPASVTTTPPYEWPTSSTGFPWAAIARWVTLTSSARDSVGFCATVTLWPALLR